MTVQDQVQKSMRLVGRVLGDKFKLTACIGIGGSGAVYKADQIALGRTVAVKILNEELCADPRRSWMIGDYLFDILSGKAAGTKTVLMAGDATTLEAATRSFCHRARVRLSICAMSQDFSSW